MGQLSGPPQKPKSVVPQALRYLTRATTDEFLERPIVCKSKCQKNLSRTLPPTFSDDFAGTGTLSGSWVQVGIYNMPSRSSGVAA